MPINGLDAKSAAKNKLYQYKEAFKTKTETLKRDRNEYLKCLAQLKNDKQEVQKERQDLKNKNEIYKKARLILDKEQEEFAIEKKMLQREKKCVNKYELELKNQMDIMAELLQQQGNID